jgi:2-methylisocitrate lyase-like PEP mutase family enzyme
VSATGLKSLLARPGAVLAPGVYDALSALMAEQAGFQALYLSGAAISYTQLGRPDVGLITASQALDVVARIHDRVGLPLIVDIDTGFGNALNVQQSVRQFERAGAQGLQIEDQTMPKRCGHLAGKELVSPSEMAGKVRAAVDARASDATLIIARTDAIAVEGFGAALDRAALYREAGADVLFIEAPQTPEQMAAITSAFGATTPLLANMVEGGRTPILSREQLEVLGYKLVITPGALVRAFAFMAGEFLGTLKADGTTAGLRERMLDFRQINDILGLDGLMEDGAGYAGLPAGTAAGKAAE